MESISRTAYRSMGLGHSMASAWMRDAMTRLARQQSGQGTVEYIGLVLLLAAVMAAVGMLSGYCGTLLTPMAANFNLVPAALLEIDKNAVIRAQVPTAIALLIVNVFLLNFLMFR